MSFEGLRVHFFKIILETTIRQEKLRVPKSFAKRYWEGITNPVSLTLPNKTEWRVSWRKSDGDVWLTDGWREFAENVSLKASHFVVFQYEETSRFNVIVFKESGLEIKYPVTETRQEPQQEKEEAVETHQEVEESVIIIDDPSPSQGNNRKRKSSSPSSQVHKKRKTSNQKEQKTNSGGKSRDMKEKIKNHLDNVKKGFRTEDGMNFFLCPIQKTYTERDLLIIPSDFVKDHLEDMKDGRKATLFVDNKEDRVWDVQLKINSSKQMTFTNGWRNFFRDHNLNTGDALVFMLTKNKELSFKVVLYPQEKEISTALPEEQKSRSIKPSSSFRTHNHAAPDADSRIISKYEAIVKVKKASNAILNLPFQYISSFVSQNKEVATLRVGEKTWRVTVLFYPENKYSRFSRDWNKFMADFDLKTGDSIHLKMVDEVKLEFQVTILRRSA